MTPEPGWRPLLEVRPNLSTQRLDAYAAEICRWNRAVRLVGPSDLHGVRLQIVDALLPFLLHPPAFPLLDIGSGAGLPGIPLAIAFPRNRVVCLEAKTKKVSFLRHIVRILSADNVGVIPSLAADAVSCDSGLLRAFATATARAVGPVPSILTTAQSFLTVGGRVYLPRGDEGPVPVPGWKLVLSESYQAPAGLGLRRLLIYQLAS